VPIENCVRKQKKLKNVCGDKDAAAIITASAAPSQHQMGLRIDRICHVDLA
jgi:hypothetical protein